MPENCLPSAALARSIHVFGSISTFFQPEHMLGAFEVAGVAPPTRLSKTTLIPKVSAKYRMEILSRCQHIAN
jgi:hypothetical protein